MKARGVGLIRHFDIREKRLRVGLVLGSVAILNLILYVVLNLPRIHRESVEEGRVAVVTQNLSEVARRVALMKDLDGRYETERAKMERFYNGILGTKDSRMIQIQREVRSIATSLQIEPETIAYSPEILDKVGLVRFGISVPLVGDYRNLRQFINRVEKSDNFLIIDSVTLGGAKDGGAMLDLNIQLSTYFDSPEARAIQATARPKPGKKT